MTRRGRCRCGVILTFSRGPKGYKRRCPNCGAGVRLRLDPRPGHRPGLRIRCPCGATLRTVAGQPTVCPHCHRNLKVPGNLTPVDRALNQATAGTDLLDAVEANQLRFPLPNPQPVSSEVVSAAASALPSKIVPAAPAHPRPADAPVCSLCGKALAPNEKACRACAARTTASVALEVYPMDAEAWTDLPAPTRNPTPRPLSWRQAVVVAVAIGAGVGLLLAIVAWWIWS